MTPSRLILLALLSIAPVGACAKAPDKPATAPAGEPALQIGVFEGTGRACAGRLTITPRTLTWNTPFSPCTASAYTLVDPLRKDGVARWAHQITNPPKRCLYKVVVLEKTGADSWNASGFQSLDAYKADASADRLDCYLVRVK